MGVLSRRGSVHVLRSAAGGMCDVIWTMGDSVDPSMPPTGTKLTMESNGELVLSSGGSRVFEVGCDGYNTRRKLGNNKGSNTSSEPKLRLTDVREELGNDAKVSKIFIKEKSGSGKKKKKKTKTRKLGKQAKTHKVLWSVNGRGDEKTKCSF